MAAVSNIESRFAQPGAITGYRTRVVDLIRQALLETLPIESALDVGAGDGWIARELQRGGQIERVQAVEVTRRDSLFVEPVLYDGRVLPFNDRSHDLVYAVDVVHHAEDPLYLLREMARVTSRWLLIKDHTSRNRLDRCELFVLDQLGNRRFGVQSPGHYQREFDWLALLEVAGFHRRALIHPARCHTGAVGMMTNRLQFLALLERNEI
jgi:SAM-dependent methyltransferase